VQHHRSVVVVGAQKGRPQSHLARAQQTTQSLPPSLCSCSLLVYRNPTYRVRAAPRDPGSTPRQGHQILEEWFFVQRERWVFLWEGRAGLVQIGCLCVYSLRPGYRLKERGRVNDLYRMGASPCMDVLTRLIQFSLAMI
jgi:hypothetical protein